jgi:hypothetical protein
MKADLDQWLARARHDRRRGVPMSPDDIMVRWIATYGWNPEQPMDSDNVGSLFCMFAQALHTLLASDAPSVASIELKDER